jgi:hypothetical protein
VPLAILAAAPLSLPDAEDLGRGAIEPIFVVALPEQEWNQETR